VYSARVRRWLPAARVSTAIAGTLFALVAMRHDETGWISTVCAADGESVIAVRREVLAPESWNAKGVLTPGRARLQLVERGGHVLALTLDAGTP
jgi:hypothetical protein